MGRPKVLYRCLCKQLARYLFFASVRQKALHRVRQLLFYRHLHVVSSFNKKKRDVRRFEAKLL